MKKTALAIALALPVLALSAFAQDTGAPPPPGGQGPGGERHRPDPEKLAAMLIEKFDANKDGKLSLDELTKALEDMRQHRPQGPPDGGPDGFQSSGTSAAAGDGERHHRGPGGPGGDGRKDFDQAGPGGGDRPAPPAPGEIAAKMIEKYASDKKGLTQSELAKALAEFRPHGPRGGGPDSKGPGAKPFGSATNASPPP